MIEFISFQILDADGRRQREFLIGRKSTNGDGKDLLIFTEFGRRVKDNGTGTDHGAAGTAFILGDPIKGGMYGEYPSLRTDDLLLGNLAYTVDFRSVYASVLEEWMQIDSHAVIGGSFETLGVV